MARLPLTFPCGEAMLAASFDAAPGKTGLLLASGGNEIRSGAFGGQAQLAANIAAAGFPVMRFDRRGVGDSEGENLGYRSSSADIAAAIEALRTIAPQVERVVAFGNCDAASALMLCAGTGCDALILSNPWTIEGSDGDASADESAAAIPPSALRARYAEKLRNPREVMRLLTGGVNLRKLAGGLVKAAGPAPEPSSLADELRDSLTRFEGEVRFLLAGRDRTAQMFLENWDGDDPRICRCDSADHAYSGAQEREWLRTQVLEVLSG